MNNVKEECLKLLDNQKVIKYLCMLFPKDKALPLSVLANISLHKDVDILYDVEDIETIAVRDKNGEVFIEPSLKELLTVITNVETEHDPIKKIKREDKMMFYGKHYIGLNLAVKDNIIYVIKEHDKMITRLDTDGDVIKVIKWLEPVKGFLCASMLSETGVIALTTGVDIMYKDERDEVEKNIKEAIS